MSHTLEERCRQSILQSKFEQCEKELVQQIFRCFFCCLRVESGIFGGRRKNDRRRTTAFHIQCIFQGVFKKINCIRTMEEQKTLAKTAEVVEN
ncbi:MAG: hypothetical protein MR355_00790 [Lachnospiraceae bacterium]|nr:hypothetical protein [Lachnospiraceae bacterium]